MTNRQMTKMARGREVATARRHRAERKAIRDFAAWLKREAEAHRALELARATHGPKSPEARAARKAWSRELRAMPTPAPDSAYRRERGDV